MDRWMVRIGAVVRKEFRHIFRDKVSMSLLFLMPVAILLIFGYALSFELHHLNIAVLDEGGGVRAERLFARMDANPKIRVKNHLMSINELDKAFARNNVRAVVVAKRDAIDIFIDGTSNLQAITTEGLLQSVIGDFLADENPLFSLPEDVPVRFMYNPALKKQTVLIPGLVLMIFILVSSIVLGTSINKEKSQGTFRLLKMTNLSSGALILGKAIPYFLISLFHVAVVLGGCLWFGVRIVGPLPLFIALCVTFSVTCMSMGLLISAWFDRPIDVLVLCWVVLFIPNVFLSGFIFPVRSIGGVLHYVVEFLPGTAFLTSFRDIAYKGLGMAYNWYNFSILIGETVLASAASLLGFRRQISNR